MSQEPKPLVLLTKEQFEDIIKDISTTTDPALENARTVMEELQELPSYYVQEIFENLLDNDLATEVEQEMIEFIARKIEDVAQCHYS